MLLAICVNRSKAPWTSAEGPSMPSCDIPSPTSFTQSDRFLRASRCRSSIDRGWKRSATRLAILATLDGASVSANAIICAE